MEQQPLMETVNPVTTSCAAVIVLLILVSCSLGTASLGLAECTNTTVSFDENFHEMYWGNLSLYWLGVIFLIVAACVSHGVRIGNMKLVWNDFARDVLSHGVLVMIFDTLAANGDPTDTAYDLAYTVASLLTTFVYALLRFDHSRQPLIERVLWLVAMAGFLVTELADAVYYIVVTFQGRTYLTSLGGGQISGEQLLSLLLLINTAVTEIRYAWVVMRWAIGCMLELRQRTRSVAAQHEEEKFFSS